MADRIRILIVDDHPVVRDGLKGMLAGHAEFEIIGEAGDGAQAVDLCAQLRPQVALMDLRMPQMDGVEAITRIRARQPGVYILVLTTYDTDADILRAIEAGATGYILKDAPREELFRAIRSTALGQSYLSPAVATRLMSQLGTRRGPAQPARAGCAGLGGPGVQQQGNRALPAHQRGDGQIAPAAYLLQAGGQRPHPGRDPGSAKGMIEL